MWMCVKYRIQKCQRHRHRLMLELQRRRRRPRQQELPQLQWLLVWLERLQQQRRRLLVLMSLFSWHDFLLGKWKIQNIRWIWHFNYHFPVFSSFKIGLIPIFYTKEWNNTQNWYNYRYLNRLVLMPQMRWSPESTTIQSKMLISFCICQRIECGFKSIKEIQ